VTRFLFCYNFETTFAGHNKIWGGLKKYLTGISSKCSRGYGPVVISRDK